MVTFDPTVRISVADTLRLKQGAEGLRQTKLCHRPAACITRLMLHLILRYFDHLFDEEDMDQDTCPPPSVNLPDFSRS